ILIVVAGAQFEGTSCVVGSDYPSLTIGIETIDTQIVMNISNAQTERTEIKVQTGVPGLTIVAARQNVIGIIQNVVVVVVFINKNLRFFDIGVRETGTGDHTNLIKLTFVTQTDFIAVTISANLIVNANTSGVIAVDI